MDARELQRYLHEHIPLSKAMGVEVVEATEERVTLSAPLAPNINHRETVFGGSASAVALLSAWALLYARLQQVRLDCRIVIQRNTVEYERPITGDFTASATIDDTVTWRKFIASLTRRGRARIAVTASLHCDSAQVGRLRGDFVALSMPARAD